MKLRIRFELTDRTAGRRVSGLSRGNVTLEGGGRLVTSAGRTPDQSMLVYISLVDLIDGIGDLLSAPSHRDWQWVGNDSSFVVDFRRAGHRVRIDAMGEPLGEFDEAEVARAVFEAAAGLLVEHRPPPSDLVAEDLESALKEFTDRFGTGPADATPGRL
jgi:hypothetical protein